MGNSIPFEYGTKELIAPPMTKSASESAISILTILILLTWLALIVPVAIKIWSWAL